MKSLLPSNLSAPRALAILAAILTSQTQAILDTNANALSDLWEKQHNNGNLFAPTILAINDEDLDGWTNAQEAAAGTDPFDPNPPDGIVTVTITPSLIKGAFTLTWPTLVGKNYQLTLSTDLVTWSNLGDPITTTQNTHSIGINTIQPDTTIPPKVFWRVVVCDLDSDGDGLTDAEEFALGLNAQNPNTIPNIPDHWLATHYATLIEAEGLSVIDASSDADGDGLDLRREGQLGTNPNIADTIGPVNLTFDDEIIEYPDLSFRDEYPSDLYNYGSINGWQSYTENHIEVWVDENSNQYVELQAHWGAHGIKQEFKMLPDGQLHFILRYKGRYEYENYANAFSIKVEGADETKINNNVIAKSNGFHNYTVMSDDEWEKYQEWHYVRVIIKAPTGENGLKPIILSLVPEVSTSYGNEEITYGGFVDMLPLELRNIKNHANQNDDVIIADWNTAKIIKENNIAWIDAHTSSLDASPRMPQLEFRFKDIWQGLRIEAKLEVEYSRGNGARAARDQSEDLVMISSTGNYIQVNGDKWSLINETDWQSEITTKGYFGGEAILTYRVMQDQEEVLPFQLNRFRIGGKNPEAARAKEFIETLENAGPQGQLWFAYAIAKTESKDYNGANTRYNQFYLLPIDESDIHLQNTRRTHAGRPVWGNDGGSSPGGYGMFQVTGDVSDATSDIPRQQIWNWQENSRAAISILEGKRSIADAWMLQQKNANNANGVALPSLTVRNVIFTDGTNHVMNHAVTMKAWNGASKPASTFTDPGPPHLGFILDPHGSGHFCYWKNAATSNNKWALNRFNAYNPPFNYVDRVCLEVE